MGQRSDHTEKFCDIRQKLILPPFACPFAGSRQIQNRKRILLSALAVQPNSFRQTLPQFLILKIQSDILSFYRTSYFRKLGSASILDIA